MSQLIYVFAASGSPATEVNDKKPQEEQDDDDRNITASESPATEVSDEKLGEEEDDDDGKKKLIRFWSGFCTEYTELQRPTFARYHANVAYTQCP